MRRTAVVNVVGLTPDLLSRTRFLAGWASGGAMATIQPPLPAVTCTSQSTFLTGKTPSEHGVVGNGWYFRDEAEVRFWRQSGRLVQAPRIWERLRELDPSATTANLFWWHAMYGGTDLTVTPRPMYPADGRKIPDVHTHPAGLRDELQDELGRFPLFHFWGPRTSIRSSEWIAAAARMVEERAQPTLSLVYLPHLDYALQRHGPEDPRVEEDVREIDRVCEELVGHLEARGVRVVILSEYGITPVERPVSLNRILREEGFLAVREELGRELLDAGASRAFAVADHQLAHVYLNDPDAEPEVRALLEAVPGVEAVLRGETRRTAGLDHPRAGDLVAIGERDAWFTYYYWLDDGRAPDFAPTVDIHRKPGYDPAELFIDPEIRFPRARAVRRLLQKKLGFRYLMDLIPLDGSLVRGSHGRLPERDADAPLLLTREAHLLPEERLEATGVYDVLLRHLTDGAR
ncbi:MAG: nucleotide pyrophosphatase/phosphodiesterase family protein [Gemmatimonadota bacterium]